MAGIYLHIPFCKTRCGYCDFFSTTNVGDRDRFVDALCGELQTQHEFLNSRKIDTIYFGGGTPSLLEPGQFRRIFATINQLWDCSALNEVTLEANPDDLSGAYLEELSGLPFNRLSLGVQAFDDGLLRLMNRRHTASAAVQAVGDARRAGFSNISIDLIYGIPGMTYKQWENSIDQTIELRPQHISAYYLTIEPSTPFGRGGMRPVDESLGEGQYALLCRKLAGAGYGHYEISNFALPGLEARHNGSYWRGEPYLGVGPSAHSYDGERLRRWCLPSLENYMKKPVYESETLSDDELYNEYVMTRLRTAQGIDLSDMKNRFEAQKLRYLDSRLSPLLANGSITKRQERYAIEEDKFLLSDALITTLFL